jgi:aminoglycoside phosphotransferase (APT) family kinase protein
MTRHASVPTCRTDHRVPPSRTIAGADRAEPEICPPDSPWETRRPAPPRRPGCVVSDPSSFPRLHDDETAIDDSLVSRLIGAQFPQWSDLPLRRVRTSGTDNAIYRLGGHLGVRLPRRDSVVMQIEKECAWLSRLAARLPVDVPTPIAKGSPGSGYPYPWLVYPWLAGADLQEATVEDRSALVQDLADFVRSLHDVDIGPQVPAAGRRGGSLASCDAATRWAMARLSGEVDVRQANAVWDAALSAPPWEGSPVWVHGDLLPGNLLVDRGRLVGVIDWSATGLGDPACDAMVAWALPTRERERFRSLLDFDGATWARARGWVVEQASLFIPYYERTLPDAVTAARRRLHAALADGA